MAARNDRRSCAGGEGGAVARSVVGEVDKVAAQLSAHANPSLNVVGQKLAAASGALASKAAARSSR